MQIWVVPSFTSPRHLHATWADLFRHYRETTGQRVTLVRWNAGGRSSTGCMLQMGRRPRSRRARSQQEDAFLFAHFPFSPPRRIRVCGCCGVGSSRVGGRPACVTSILRTHFLATPACRRTCRRGNFWSMILVEVTAAADLQRAAAAWVDDGCRTWSGQEFDWCSLKFELLKG